MENIQNYDIINLYDSLYNLTSSKEVNKFIDVIIEIDLDSDIDLLQFDNIIKESEVINKENEKSKIITTLDVIARHNEVLWESILNDEIPEGVKVSINDNYLIFLDSDKLDIFENEKEFMVIPSKNGNVVKATYLNWMDIYSKHSKILDKYTDEYVIHDTISYSEKVSFIDSAKMSNFTENEIVILLDDEYGIFNNEELIDRVVFKNEELV